MMISRCSRVLQKENTQRTLQLQLSIGVEAAGVRKDSISSNLPCGLHGADVWEPARQDFRTAAAAATAAAVAD